MSFRAILLVSLVAAPAAFASGFWRGENPPEGPDVIQPAARNAPVVAQPGVGAGDAAIYLASVNAPAPPPAPVVVSAAPTPPPPPPPPDVAVTFRQEVTAVLVEPGTAPRVVLGGGGGSRTLTPGDPYRDGWTLSTVSTTNAVLRRGDETRTVGLFTTPPEMQTASRPALPTFAGGQITFTNGVEPGRLTGGQVETVLGVLRESGADNRQISRIESDLREGAVSPDTAMRVLAQVGSSGEIDPTRINSLVTVFNNAGIIPDEIAERMQGGQMFRGGGRRGGDNDDRRRREDNDDGPNGGFGRGR